ncbi:MAG: type IV pilus assembly protein PilM [Actinomycetota bacterium]
MALGARGIVGLDIGSSAVRGALVASGRSGLSLQRFGQVPLPEDAVVDGEIRDEGLVSEAIAQLWKRAKFGTKRAVIGVANQRVIVRQVDLPFLEEKDFRSSLRFQVADHIPMPVDDAELDFEVLEDFHTPNGDHMMKVLLVAAATEMVEAFVSSVSGGGVETVGVDLTPFAVARAVSPVARGETGIPGAQAVVDVGAGVTNIVVHVGGEPRFVRILLVGGDDVTETLSNELGVPTDEAEAIKMDLSVGAGSQQAEQIVNTRVRSLVEEIRGSIDYYSSQDESQPVNSVLMTGGGSLVSELVHRLEQTLRTEVRQAAPLSDMSISKSGLTQEQAAQIEPVSAAAIGLAMGAVRS